MIKTILAALLIMCANHLNSQKQICDTSGYYLYFLKKNTVSPKFNCDAYIISELTKDRFLFLNSEYKSLLAEWSELDETYGKIIDSFDLNVHRLESIYDLQKSKIDDMNNFAMPKLESSIDSLHDATKNLNDAKVSMDNALSEIKKAKNKKWIYAVVGFLAGGLTIAAIK